MSKNVTDEELEVLRKQITDRRRSKDQQRENDPGNAPAKRTRILSSSNEPRKTESGGERSSSFMPRNLKVRPSRAELERRRAMKLAQKRKGRDDRPSRESRDRERPRDIHRDSPSRWGDKKKAPEKSDAVMELVRQQLTQIKAKAQQARKAVALEEGEIGGLSKADRSKAALDDDDDSDHSAYDDFGGGVKKVPNSSAAADEVPSPVIAAAAASSTGDVKEKELVNDETTTGLIDKPVEREEQIENDSPPLKKRKRIHIPAFMGARKVQCYKRLNTIDEGTYGVVHRAQDTVTGEVVALKKIKMEKTSGSFPITSLREINILMAIDHPNIVKLKEIVIGEDLKSIYMVMEYLDHDMKMLMGQMKQPFRQSEVKTLMRQLLSAVNALHKGWILHRDLKTSNLLYNNDPPGLLKVCDFGLARKYGSPIGKYTSLVVTLWYRAPELLLGAKTYTEAVDMWSVGCIFAEFLTRKPLLPGKGEMDQLERIFNLLGSPTKEQWPDFENLPHAKNFRWAKNKRSKLREKFPKQNFGGGFYLDDLGFDLMSRLLAFDPKKRISAEDALDHEWFKAAPRPQILELMPTFPSANEKSRRRKSRKKSEEKNGDKGANGFMM